MSYISNTQNWQKLLKIEVTVDGTGSTNTAQKYTAGIQKEITDDSINDVIFPAGAYYVSVRPTAFDAPIIVNGDDLYLGEEKNLEDRINHFECEQDFVPEIQITANGNPYIITISYPSNHSIDFSQIGL